MGNLVDETKDGDHAGMAAGQVNAESCTRRWPAVMVDLETMALTADAAILEIGAVCFDLGTLQAGPKFFRKISLKDNQDQGRAIDADTLAWWMSRWKANGVPDLEAGSVPLYGALWDFKDWWTEHCTDEAEFWSRGKLDAQVLEHAMDADVPFPWHPKRVRDQRGILKWEDVKPTEAEHGALNDALLQVGDLFKAAERNRHPLIASFGPYDFGKGWEVYRNEISATQACPLPYWSELPSEIRNAFACAVRASVGPVRVTEDAVLAGIEREKWTEGRPPAARPLTPKEILPVPDVAKRGIYEGIVSLGVRYSGYSNAVELKPIASMRCNHGILGHAFEGGAILHDCGICWPLLRKEPEPEQSEEAARAAMERGAH